MPERIPNDQAFLRAVANQPAPLTWVLDHWGMTEKKKR